MSLQGSITQLTEEPIDNTIQSTTTVRSGFTWLRARTILPDGITLIIESGGRVIFS